MTKSEFKRMCVQSPVKAWAEYERLKELLKDVSENKSHVEKCFLAATEKNEILEDMLWPPEEVQKMIRGEL